MYDTLLDGSLVVDALWQEIVQWAVVEQPPLAAVQQRKLMTERILSDPDGDRILAEFNALEEAA